MPAVLFHQPVSSTLPLILVYGESSPFIEAIITSLLSSSHIIHISQSQLTPLSNADHYSFVKQIDSDLIQRLKDKIDYAVVYVDDVKNKSVVGDLLIKLHNDNAKTSMVIPVRKAENFYDLVVHYKNYSHVTFHLLGDLIDPSVTDSDSLSILIARSFAEKRITLTGNDLQPVYPIAITDAVESIHHSLFGDLKRTRLFLLFYNNPQTYLSMTHLLRNIEPELSVRFNEKSTSTTQPQKSHVDLYNELYQKTLLEAHYPMFSLSSFEKGVQRLIHSSSYTPVKKRRMSLTPSALKQHVRYLQERMLVNAFIIGILLFGFITVLSTVAGIYFGKKAIQELNNGNYQQAEQQSRNALLFLNIADPTISTGITLTSRFAPQLKVHHPYQTLQTHLNMVSTALNDVLPTVKQLPNGTSLQAVEQLQAHVAYLYFEAEHQSLNQLSPIHTYNASPYINYVSLISVLPEILGFHREKTYLLLFQNNGELRPNGGFIGSIGKFTLKSGKITDYSISDVYEADGQLKSHIEPHYIIRRYLQPHLYLRDSNFALDFQESATSSATLYKLETGTLVDGVVAIDFDVLKRIIAAAGPLSLPSYNITLDEKNTFDFLQTTIEKDFFPGSTQKKDVLMAVLNQLILALNNNPNKAFTIAQLFPQLMEEKHILFAFNDQAVQKIFTLNNLGGSIEDLRTKEKSVIKDFLSVNEANIGVNKANTNVSRTIHYQSAIKKDSIVSTVEVDITNTHSKDYTAYIRFVVPKGSDLSAVEINQEEQEITAAITDFRQYESKTFKKPKGLEVDTQTANGYTVFGMVTTVPSNKSQSISIRYQNGAGTNLSVPFTYSLWYSKQPGTNEIPLTVDLEYPETYTPSNVSNAQLDKNSLRFQQSIRKDLIYDVKFTE